MNRGHVSGEEPPPPPPEVPVEAALGPGMGMESEMGAMEAEMERDPSAYLGAPCLSFDILQDRAAAAEVPASTAPLSLYLCAGTQAETTAANRLILMKLSNVRVSEPKVGSDSESDSSDDDDDEEDEEKQPRLEIAMIPYHGTINRVRVSVAHTLYCVLLSLSRAHTGSLTHTVSHAHTHTQSLTHTHTVSHTHARTHMCSRLVTGVRGGLCVAGRLVTGDVKGRLHVWEPREDGTWSVDQRPLTGHSQSAEDVQWSPNEPTVFASCSVDTSLRVWDIRAPPSAACMISVPNAHSSDVNVISWNRMEPFLVSGGDDGAVTVWDLRQLQVSGSVATFKQHRPPITSVQWHPSDPGGFAAAGADDRVTQWDLAVERDGEAGAEEARLPPQLLFVHEGDNDLKELHWASRYPGVLVTTAHSGFTVFRTISV
uniref:Glutamate-rich WD repeat-containing protein 1 n=1 Tax=Callorhinchus milii TaxID=7868 RepID=A0A4W3IM23_CALMI